MPKPRWTRDALSTTAIALMATAVTTSGLGVLFWAGASRLYTPDRLGEDAALISAMMLLSIVSPAQPGHGDHPVTPPGVPPAMASRPRGGILGMQRYGLIGMGLSWFLAHLIVAVSVLPALRTICTGAQGSRASHRMASAA